MLHSYGEDPGKIWKCMFEKDNWVVYGFNCYSRNLMLQDESLQFIGNRPSGAVKVKATAISVYQYKAGLSKGMLLNIRTGIAFILFSNSNGFFSKDGTYWSYQSWSFLWTHFFFSLSFFTGSIILMTPFQGLEKVTLITAKLLKWVMLWNSLLWCHW